jgi:hypothetical protein
VRRLRYAALAIAVAVSATAVPAARTTLARFTDGAVSTGDISSDTLTPPTALSATGGASVDLAWTPTVDGYAAGYDILRSATSGGPYGVVGSVAPATLTAATDAPLDGTWFYVMRTTYQAWTSALSNEASATVTNAVTTPESPCSMQAADSSGAGDDDGYQTNPIRACTDDGSAANDTRSGIGGDASCGSGAIPDPRKDRHQFWGHAFGLPPSVTSIDGITVRADLGLNNATGSTNLCIQLSWDGGATWTDIQSTAVTVAPQTTYMFGGPSDTWGRSWTLAELDPAVFRIRVIDASTRANMQFRLDYLAARVTYTP